jgi:hypothetical protein
VSRFELPLSASSTPAQVFTYTNAEPGPVAGIQSAPHPSDVVKTGFGDTSNWVFVPDVGSDLVRIYHIENDSSLIECPAVATQPGDGPVQVGFGGPDIYMYVANSLSNTVTSYHRNVSVPRPCLGFDTVETVVPYPPGESIPSTARVAGLSGGQGSYTVTLENDGRFKGDDSIVRMGTGPLNGRKMEFRAISSQYGKSGTWDGVLPYPGPYGFTAIANRVSGTVVITLDGDAGTRQGHPQAKISLGNPGTLDDPQTGISSVLWFPA